MEVEDDPRSRYSDYSCVTPLENLTNDIELIFRKWQSRDKLIHHHWKEIRENEIFGNNIRIEFYSTPPSNTQPNRTSCDVEIDKDSNTEIPFRQRWCADRSGSNAAHLCEWFGVSRCAAVFLTRESSLLSGWSTSAHPSPSDKAKASSVLSALLLAATNCNITDLPLFGVVIADSSGNSRFGPYDVICGFMHRHGKLTRMDCDQRNQVTAQYRRLNGLVELFDSRLKRISSEYDSSRAKIQARHLWRWEPSMWGMKTKEWRRWPYQGEDKFNPRGTRWLQQVLGVLPFSTSTNSFSKSIYNKRKDPLVKIEVLAHWPVFRCGAKIETTTHSTLRRHEASVQMRVEWNTPSWDSHPPLANKCIFMLASLVHAITLEINASSAPFAMSDLKHKSNLKMAYQSVEVDMGKSEQIAGSVSASLKDMCSFMTAPRAAPPADIDEEVSKKVSTIICTEISGDSQGSINHQCLWNYIPRSAPVGRLVSLLAWYMSSLETLTGSGGISHVWCEALQQVRAQWDAQIPLVSLSRQAGLDQSPPAPFKSVGRPRASSSSSSSSSNGDDLPDLQLNILSQKLQVINLCIRSVLEEGSGEEAGAAEKSDTGSEDKLEEDEPEGSIEEAVAVAVAAAGGGGGGESNVDVQDEEEEEESFRDCEDEMDEEVSEAAHTEGQADEDNLETVAYSQASTENGEGIEDKKQQQRVKHEEDMEKEEEEEEGEDGYASCDEFTMVVPRLQPLAPVTSDSEVLVKHMMSQMKPGDEAYAKIHKQLRLSTLMADVYAFKQVNPKAKFTHFKEWYCPTSNVKANEQDEHEEEGNGGGGGGRGVLGLDIEHYDSICFSKEELVQAWESGGSSKVLFNHTNEAEKALHYLETLPTSSAMIQLLIGLIPTCLFSISCAVNDILSREGESHFEMNGGGNIPCLTNALNKLHEVGKATVRALEEPYPSGTIPQGMLISMDKFIATLSHVELMMEQTCSLLHRFPDSYELVDALLKGEHVKLDDDHKQLVFSFLDLEHQKTRSQPPPPSATQSSEDKVLLSKQQKSSPDIDNDKLLSPKTKANEAEEDDGDDEECVSVNLSQSEATEVTYREEDEPFQSLAKPTEREYILRFTAGNGLTTSAAVASTKSKGGLDPNTSSSCNRVVCSVRMGCLVNEADTFPTTRAVRVTLKTETLDANSTDQQEQT